MKIALYVVTAVLLLMHSFTAVIGEPGDFGYALVIKPYPSLLKSVPTLEERVWRERVASGEIPQWVAAQRYIVIATGSAESKTRPWVYAYTIFILLTYACTLTCIVLLWRSFRRRVLDAE